MMRELLAVVLIPLLVAVLLTAIAIPAHAEELIRRFHVDLKVNADGSLDVLESITVAAEGKDIRRGIERRIPLRYVDRHGGKVEAAFNLREVRRNGELEPRSVGHEDGDILLRIGSPDVLLPSGDHIYTISYRFNHALDARDGEAELYWNVTGHDWPWTIRHASATVSLPGAPSESQLRLDGWTGAFGSVEQELKHSVTDGKALFSASEELESGEGLTIQLGFPASLLSVHLEPLARGSVPREQRIAEGRAERLAREDNYGDVGGIGDTLQTIGTLLLVLLGIGARAASGFRDPRRYVFNGRFYDDQGYEGGYRDTGDYDGGGGFSGGGHGGSSGGGGGGGYSGGGRSGGGGRGW